MLALINRPTDLPLCLLTGSIGAYSTSEKKINEQFLARHHDVNPDSLDILENLGEIVQGDNLDYYALYSLIENNSLTLHQNYEYIKSKMDIDNLSNTLFLKSICQQGLARWKH